MPNTLHMQTEQARELSKLMHHYSENLTFSMDALRQAGSRLEMDWQGGSSAAMTGRFRSAAQLLQTRIQELKSLAVLLDTEVAQWEETDRNGASLFGGLTATLPWDLSEWLLITGGAGVIAWPGLWGGHLIEIIEILPAWLRNWLQRIFPVVVLPDPGMTTLPVREPLPEIVRVEPIETPDPGFTTLPVREPLPEIVGVEPIETPDPGFTTLPVREPIPEIVKEGGYHYEVPTRAQGSQHYNQACTPTSISMVTDYYHNLDSSNATIGTQDLINMSDASDRPANQGISLSNLSDELQELGYETTTKVNVDMTYLREQLATGPVIVTAGVGIAGPGSVTGGDARMVTGPGNVMHAMVVTGINAEGTQVYLNDPWSGQQLTFPVDTFQNMWNRGLNGTFIIRP